MTKVLPSYAFNASAVGLGGIIRKNGRTTVLPTMASVCLASAGGEASNRVDDYSRDGISFTRAETRVGGYTTKIDGGVRHSTFSEVLLLNLKFFERISIARAQAIVTSTRDITSDDPAQELVADRTQFWVKLLYHGVEIDGDEYDTEIDTELCDATSYKHFAELLGRRGPKLLPETQEVLAANVLQNHAPVNAPLVGFAKEKRNAQANKVDVEAFGRVRFGDFIVKPDRRRVSLVRLTLDGNWVPELPSHRRRRVVQASVQADAKASILADHQTGHFQSEEPGDGGSASSDNGSNGVPIYP